MARDVITLRPVPTGESCARVGESGYAEIAALQCQRYIALLRFAIGPEPDGARLRMRRADTEFDPYIDVVIEYDDQNPAACHYALRCERDAPTRWPESSGPAMESAKPTEEPIPREATPFAAGVTPLRKEYDMAMQYKVVIVVALILLLSLTATRTVDGQVPTAADFAACNEEAPRAVKAGTASPIMGDHLRADSARGGAMTTNSRDGTGKVIESSDSQIHGMEAEGAKNAAYQAAYRGCMRRKGF